jgi:hypothetical protein
LTANIIKIGGSFSSKKRFLKKKEVAEKCLPLPNYLMIWLFVDEVK